VQKPLENDSVNGVSEGTMTSSKISLSGVLKVITIVESPVPSWHCTENLEMASWTGRGTESTATFSKWCRSEDLLANS